MQTIEIKISKAKIESFSVVLKDDFPVVSASIGLYTDEGKSITTYSISSDHWQEQLKFDLPIEMIEPIKEIGRRLEKIVSSHCQDHCNELEIKKEEV